MNAVAFFARSKSYLSWLQRSISYVANLRVFHNYAYTYQFSFLLAYHGPCLIEMN